MTKEEKEARNSATFQERLRLMSVTVPPADKTLISKMSGVPLSPAELPPSAPALKEVVPFVSGARKASEQISPQSGQPNPAASFENEAEESLPVPQRAAARLYNSGDPKREAMLDSIAQHVRARRKREKVPVRRVALNIDSDVFSRVSHVAMSRQLEKGEVLSYLLDRYLPEEGTLEPPAYISEERSDEVLNSNHLFYLEDESISKRFDWLMQRFGLLKVDIVSAIVLRFLPAAPFVVPPKRKPRRKRF